MQVLEWLRWGCLKFKKRGMSEDGFPREDVWKRLQGEKVMRWQSPFLLLYSNVLPSFIYSLRATTHDFLEWDQVSPSHEWRLANMWGLKVWSQGRICVIRAWLESWWALELEDGLHFSLKSKDEAFKVPFKKKKKKEAFKVLIDQQAWFMAIERNFLN